MSTRPATMSHRVEPVGSAAGVANVIVLGANVRESGDRRWNDDRRGSRPRQ